MGDFRAAPTIVVPAWRIASEGNDFKINQLKAGGAKRRRGYADKTLAEIDRNYNWIKQWMNQGVACNCAERSILSALRR